MTQTGGGAFKTFPLEIKKLCFVEDLQFLSRTSTLVTGNYSAYKNHCAAETIRETIRRRQAFRNGSLQRLPVFSRRYQGGYIKSQYEINKAFLNCKSRKETLKIYMVLEK